MTDLEEKKEENSKPNLFVKGDFISSSGLKLDWKIDCDALTDEDIETIAYLISKRWVFRKVVGVPRGGLRLASALEKYKNLDALTVLIVDDVFTTGKSIKEYMDKYTMSRGVVIFSRDNLPWGIDCIFKLTNHFA